MRGRFIVLEGIDGCGKTTQSQLLQRALQRRGMRPLRLREPGGTPIGEAVRELLLDPASGDLASWTEVFLFMASRAQLLDERVRPALARGTTVILDRYYYSTAAYQGAAGGVGVPVVLGLARTARLDAPDRVFVLDIDPAAARERLGRTRDRMERKGAAYQRRVRRGFLAMARRDPKRLKVIDAGRPPAHVHDEIMKEVARVL